MKTIEELLIDEVLCDYCDTLPNICEMCKCEEAHENYLENEGD